MNVDVFIQSGIDIQVTPQASPLYVIGNLPVFVTGGGQGVTMAWVDQYYYPRYNPSGYITGFNSSLFIQTGQSGLFYPANNPSGFITFAPSQGVALIAVTGQNLTGNVGITGVGGTSVTISGNNIIISGGSSINTGNFVTTNQTGGFVSISETGQFITKAVTGIAASGNTSLTGLITFVGGTGIVLTQSGQFITIYSSAILAAANSYLFSVNVSSGIDTLYVSFPTNLGNNPTVIVDLAGTGSGQNIIPVQVAETFSSGFNVSFGANIPDTGFNLTVFCATSTATGLITTIINNITVNTGGFVSTGQTGQFAPSGMTGQFITTAQTGIFYPASNPNGYITLSQVGVTTVTVTGASISGNINLTGLRGINVSLSGQYVLISGGDTGQFISTAMTGQFIDSAHTGGFVSISQTGQFITSALTGQYAPAGLTGQFVTTATTGQVPQLLLNVTGQILSGNLPITGISGISIYTSGAYLVFSGGGTSQGGGGSVGGVNNINVSGITISGNVIMTGIAGVGVSLSGNAIVVSGSSLIRQIDVSILGISGSVLSSGLYITQLGQSGYFRFFNSVAEVGNFVSGWVPQSLNINAANNLNLISQSGVTGIICSGTQTSLLNTVNMGAFSFNVNPGTVTLMDFPVTSDSGLSGIEQSYSFNVAGTTVAKAYCEGDNISGIQNASFHLTAGLVYKPSGISGATILGDKTFYYYTGMSGATWTMSTITFTGRTYIIKNRGNSVTLTGNASGDQFFYTGYTSSYTILSGEGKTVISDGLIWNVI